MRNRGRINGGDQNDFSICSAPICRAETIQWRENDQLSARIPSLYKFLLFICLPSVDYLWRRNSVCGAWGGRHTALWLHLARNHQLLPTAWFEQTSNTHAEQSCQQQMSADHSRHITNESVRPVWLLLSEVEDTKSWGMYLFVLYLFVFRKGKAASNQARRMKNSVLTETALVLAI